ncbi:hypothetical protein [Burkholderia cepacia]|uniref:hypothetical protein n=1 Tax=Burkholderia cepacia TaxID=292 RepID=UPI002AB79701|nr:hypothetical protein [Burkholderia cepacia]
MERDYSYAGFNIHIVVQAFASITPRNFKMPDVGYTAVVTITKAGVRTPVLPQIRLSDRDGRQFSGAADTLLAASRAGQRAIDDLLSA